METPDVTKAQVIALVQAAIAVALAFGVNLSAAEQTKLLTVSGVIASVIVAADVAIRRGRQKHLAGKDTAVTLAAQLLRELGYVQSADDPTIHVPPAPKTGGSSPSEPPRPAG
jgi:hypothetical protein